MKEITEKHRRRAEDVLRALSDANDLDLEEAACVLSLVHLELAEDGGIDVDDFTNMVDACIDEALGIDQDETGSRDN